MPLYGCGYQHTESMHILLTADFICREYNKNIRRD